MESTSDIIARLKASQQSSQPATQAPAQATAQTLPEESTADIIDRIKNPNGINALSKNVRDIEAQVNENPNAENQQKLNDAYKAYYQNTTLGQRAAFNLTPNLGTVKNIGSAIEQGAGNFIENANKTYEGMFDHPINTLVGLGRGTVSGLGQLAALPIQGLSAFKQQVLAAQGNADEAAKTASERAADTATLNNALSQYKQYGAGPQSFGDIGESGQAAANVAETVAPLLAAPGELMGKGVAELSEAEKAAAAAKALKGTSNIAQKAANVLPTALGAAGTYAGEHFAGPIGAVGGGIAGKTIGAKIADVIPQSAVNPFGYKSVDEALTSLDAAQTNVQRYSKDVDAFKAQAALDPQNSVVADKLKEAQSSLASSQAELANAQKASDAMSKAIDDAQPGLTKQVLKNIVKPVAALGAYAEASQAPGTSVGGAIGNAALISAAHTIGSNIGTRTQAAFNEGLGNIQDESSLAGDKASGAQGANEVQTGGNRGATGPGIDNYRDMHRLSNPVEKDTIGSDYKEKQQASDVLLTPDSPAAKSVPVESDKINRIGYDPNSQIMYVHMNGVTRDGYNQYLYHDVTPEEHQDFMDADSKGKYFEDNVKFKYKTTAIDPYHSYDELIKDSQRRGTPPAAPTPSGNAPVTPAAPAEKAAAAAESPEAPAPFMGSVPAMPPTEATLPPRASAGEGYATAEQIKQQALAQQKPIAEPAKPLQIQKEPEYQSLAQSKQFQANIQNMQNEIDAKNMELEDMEKSGLADTPQHKLLKQSIDAQNKLMERRIQQFYGTSKPVPNPVLKSFKSP